MEYVSSRHPTDSFAVQKRTRIGNMIVLTASSASGVLVLDAAFASIRGNMTLLIIKEKNLRKIVSMTINSCLHQGQRPA